MNSALEIVEALLARWRDDPAGCMDKYIARDIVYLLNVSAELHRLGGETVGWDAVRAKMLGIRDEFDYVVYRPRIFGVRGNTVRARIEFIYRHKRTGELLTGTFRSELTVEDGMIVRVAEFVDAPLLESFMRLVSQGD